MNQKHQLNNFDFKLSKEYIKSLDTVLINSNSRLHTMIYKKPTDCQNYLHPK